MVASERERVASAALITMEEFVTWSYAAYSATLAMIDVLLKSILVPKLADPAVEVRKLNATENAVR